MRFAVLKVYCFAFWMNDNLFSQTFLQCWQNTKTACADCCGFAREQVLWIHSLHGPLIRNLFSVLDGLQTAEQLNKTGP